MKLATSVDVERVFSQGRIVLSHLRNRLSVQSTRALMCLGVWSLLGFVNNSDIKAVVVLPGVPADEREDALADGWDAI
jgi:hAT family protein